MPRIRIADARPATPSTSNRMSFISEPFFGTIYVCCSHAVPRMDLFKLEDDQDKAKFSNVAFECCELFDVSCRQCVPSRCLKW